MRDSKGRFLPGHGFGFIKGIGLKESNINWKGDDVGYIGLHYWVKRNWPGGIPKSCQTCSVMVYGKKGLHLANITGIYSRDFSNWQFMCPKCHVKFDGIRKIPWNKGKYTGPLSEARRKKISQSITEWWNTRKRR